MEGKGGFGVGRRLDKKGGLQEQEDLGGETGKEETEGVGDAKFLGSADRGTEGGRAGEVGRTGTAEWGQERAERELIREDSKESFDSIVLSRD